MKRIARSVGRGLSLLLVAALPACGSTETGEETVVFHPRIVGYVEGMRTLLSYNDDGSWRIIRIESPDGAYIEAEDSVTDNDGEFDSRTISPSDITLNHPLTKYNSFKVLEKIYQRIKMEGAKI